MRGIKRLVSILTALAILLSFNISFASAEEFSDLKADSTDAQAVGLLSSIGIIVGYEDGTFGPNRSITRAEAAAVMVRALGMERDAKNSAGPTNFSDVAAKHWASGYINVATSVGVIIGFPDGTFHPEENVTYEQIVKMIVCAIGHEMRALEGGYPQGYIKAASDAGFTKGVGGNVGQDASRLTVAKLVYNALEVEMMGESSFSTGILGTTYGPNGKTILNDYLKLDKVDAVVTDSYIANDVYDTRNKDIALEITRVYGSNTHVNNSKYITGNEYNFDEGSTDASIYLGYAVTAYIGEDEDTGEDTIFAVTKHPSRNDTVEITQNRFSAEDSDDSVLYYTRRVSDNRLTKLNLDKNCVVVENGTTVGYISSLSDGELSDYYDAFDLLTLVDNNSDNDYDFMFISIFDDVNGVEFVVTDIDKDYGEYYFSGDDGELEIDLDDPEKHYTIIRDGKGAEADDIEEDDCLTCLDTEKAIVTIYVSSENFKGSVDEVDENEDEYYIGNGIYTLSPAFQGTLDVGDEGTFYLNYLGKIAYSTVSSTAVSGDYVFITNYGTDTNFSKKTYKIQLVNATGRVMTYTFKSTMKYVTDRGVSVKKAPAEDVYEFLTSQHTDIGRDYGIDGYVGIAKVKTSAAGTVSEIYLPGSYEDFYEQTKYAGENNREYSEKRKTYGVYDLSKNVLAFNLDKSEEDLVDAVEVGGVKDFFSDGDSYSFLAYSKRNNDIDAIVITDGIASVDYSAHAILVSSKRTVLAGDERATRISGICDGQNVTYTIDPDYSYDVEPGNIILIETGSNGYITKLEIVANTTEYADDLPNAMAKGSVDVPTDEDANVYAGLVSDKGSRNFAIEGIDDVFYNDTNTAYYLTDYTGRTTTYAKGSFSSIKTSGSTDSFVVVRMYEDEMIDVFVFRIEADTYNGTSSDIWDNMDKVEDPTEKPTEKPTESASEPETTVPSEPETTAPTNPSETETTAPTVPSEPETTAPTEPETAAPTEPETVAPTEPETTAPTEDDTSSLSGVTPTAPPTEAPTEAPTQPGTEPATETPSQPEIMIPTLPTGIVIVVPTQPSTEEPSEEPIEPTEAPTEQPTEKPTAPDIMIPTLPTVPTNATDPTAPTETSVKTDSKLAKEVLALVNAERAKVGAAPLTWDSTLAKIAEDYSVDMVKTNNFSHTGKDGSTLGSRLAKGGVKYTTTAGENIAFGQKTAKAVVESWMKSEGHKANILNPKFTKMGVGVAYDSNGTPYWTQDFCD